MERFLPSLRRSIAGLTLAVMFSSINISAASWSFSTLFNDFKSYMAKNTQYISGLPKKQQLYGSALLGVSFIPSYLTLRMVSFLGKPQALNLK